LDLIYTNISYTYIALIIAMGFIGGFLAGMLGVGGGIIFVPFLQEMVKSHAVASDKVPYILANSLAIVFAVGISGTIKQYKLKNTDIRASLVTGVFAVISSLTISFLLRYYHINNPKVFSYIFAGILVITAARMLYGHVKKREEDGSVKVPPLKHFIPAGLFAGMVTSLTGLGGGVVMVPYFNKILKLPIKFATGLSLSVIPIIALPLLVFYGINQPGLRLSAVQTGFILWDIVLPIIVVAMIAAPLGIRFAQKISSKTLLGIFMVFILLTLAKTLFF
jgi:uncharacterized membrane protein YfcA